MPDLIKDEWVAINMGDRWYPGQFIQYDSVEKSIEVTFLQRSSSSMSKFVWPSTVGNEDKGWVDEGASFLTFGS